MIKLAQKMTHVAPSATKAMTQLATQLREQGRDIITLSQGEPDFATPQNIRQAAIKAIEEGKTVYTAVAGILPLREAICEKFERENDLHYTPDQITVGCGAKQLLFNALMATLDEGDEVVFPTPCWVSYPEMVKLAGGTPVAIETSSDDGFILQPQALRAALTSRTKWLMLNSPSNPTGAVYSQHDLQILAEVLRDFPHVMVLSDDIYEHLVYGDKKFSTLAQAVPDFKDRVLTVNGVSKSYAMTGWRVGYGAGPAQLIKAMNTIQGQSTSHTCSISQYAAVEALRGPQDFITEFRAAFERRRNFVTEALANINGLECTAPDGAFYVFVDCRALLGKTTPHEYTLQHDTDVASFLLEDAGVAVVPGSGFLAPGFLRLSYATDDETLHRATDKIAQSIAKLS